MAGFDNDTVYGINADFSDSNNQSPLESNGLFSDGDLWIGATAPNVGGTHINVGTITSTGGTLSVTYDSPNINIESSGGATPIEEVLTANATPQFVKVGTTSTVNFDLSNLVLGTDLPALTSGSQNVGMGQDVFIDLTSGDSNVAVGFLSGNAMTEGIRNTLVGVSSGTNITTGDENTIIGSDSGSSVLTGSRNIGIGHDSLGQVNLGSNNISIGSGSGLVGTNSSNIIIGGSGSGNNTIRIGVNGSGAGQQDSTFIAGITGVTVAGSEPVGVDTNGQISGFGFGTSGQVLTSNGAATSPTWQDAFTGSGQIGAVNLGLSYSAGTTTIKGSNGNDLSSSNPSYITLVSNANADQLVTFKLESNKTFNDSVAGSSVFAGSLFDFDTGDNSGTTEVPFYLYAILDDNDQNPIFAVSRLPNVTVTTVSNFFSASGGGADNAGSILSLEAVTTTDYDENNTLLVGIITMDINGSNDWILRKVDTNDIGVGRYGVDTNFSVPLGTRGAASNSLFLDNGGTAPTIQSGLYQYRIDPFSGTCTMSYDFVLGGSPAGSVNTEMLLPLDGSQSSEFVFAGMTIIGGTGGNNFPVYYKRNPQAGDERFLQLRKGDGTSGRWQHDEFTSGDFIFASHTYLL